MLDEAFRKHLTRGDTPMAQRMAELIREELDKHYRGGHPWLVEVESDPRVGCVKLRNLLCSSQEGMVKRLSNLGSAAELRQWAMRAGGEILERFDVPRDLPADRGFYPERAL